MLHAYVTGLMLQPLSVTGLALQAVLQAYCYRLNVTKLK